MGDAQDRMRGSRSAGNMPHDYASTGRSVRTREEDFTLDEILRACKSVFSTLKDMPTSYKYVVAKWDDARKRLTISWTEE